MRLHEADCHLGYARLALADKDLPEARAHLDIADAMITEMDYRLRDPELKLLEKAIG